MSMNASCGVGNMLSVRFRIGNLTNQTINPRLKRPSITSMSFLLAYIMSPYIFCGDAEMCHKIGDLEDSRLNKVTP